jgi:tetratricopeptide (TPR) repeat protein
MRAGRWLWVLPLLAAPLANAQAASQPGQPGAQVRVWEGTLPLAASDEGPPDENPPFDAFSPLEDYPYTMRETVRPTETMHNWRAVFLENEYLKCTVLPDLGGHLYDCVDKIDGVSMFYANPTIKKALIAYRGAWSPFGVEFNFPISHNWVTLSPVDFAYSRAADGSVSVTVGNRDRVYGMDWTVQIVLRPASTVVEEHVTLSNPSDLRHHYFWWSNGGVQVWDDSRIWYPTQFTTDGDTWPVNLKGKDVSLIANQTGGYVEAFALGSNEPFLGVYSPHTGAGVVHYAEHAELPAKKVFSWGLDQDALSWRAALSDDKSAYIELQAGLFKDQDTYGFLGPSEAVRFTEYWMPVRGIGAISRANLNGVVAIVRRQQADGKIGLTASFNANHAIAGAKIAISDGASSVFSETTSLEPSKTWTHTISDLPADRKYTFTLSGANGETLLRHTEDTYDLVPREQIKAAQPPAYQPPPQNPWIDKEFLRDGWDHEAAGDYLAAWQSYEAGLAKFPASVALLKAAGRLAVSQFRFDEADKYLTKAAASAPSDAESRYYRAVAENALGRNADARADLEAARQAAEFRTPAGILLAESLAQDKDAAGALKMLEESCPSAPANLRCVEETAALERATGDTVGAKRLVADALMKFPTSMFLQNERARLGTPATGLNRHLAADTHRILNLVIQYNRLGLYSDSLDLLTRSYPEVAADEREPGLPGPANDPLLAYYRGFCRLKLGQPAQADFDAASHISLLYVFPNEAETFPVLRAALAANPSDASAHFLLGALLFSKGIVDPALDEWQKAEALNPTIPSLQLSLGRALLEMKKQPGAAIADLQRGIAAEPTNSALYVELDQAMGQTGKSASQCADMMKTFPDPALMSSDLVHALVERLRQANRIAEANAIIAQHVFARKEGENPLVPLAPAK